MFESFRMREITFLHFGEGINKRSRGETKFPKVEGVGQKDGKPRFFEKKLKEETNLG